jgi:hypothetical protein
MEIGETRTWEFVVFTDKSDAEMTLSWASAVGELPADTMLSFRRTQRDPGQQSTVEWQDIRQVGSVDVAATGRITKIPFELRAERFALTPLEDLKADDAGDQVQIRWKPTTNAFIAGYTVQRMEMGENTSTPEMTKLAYLPAETPISSFVDTDVESEATYIYQVVTHFQTGVTVPSDLIRVTLQDPLKDLKAVAGEKQVTLQWAAAENPFIKHYEVVRHLGLPAAFGTGEATRYTVALQPTKREMAFVDTAVEEEADYTYQVEVRYQNDNRFKSDLFTVNVLPIIKATRLMQSYPNPFNPETWIPYDLEKEAAVVIEIYNVNGQLVRRLDLGIQSRGRYASREKAAYWDGRTQLGERASSGVYFYMMQAGSFADIRKMVILK